MLTRWHLQWLVATVLLILVALVGIVVIGGAGRGSPVTMVGAQDETATPTETPVPTDTPTPTYTPVPPTNTPTATATATTVPAPECVFSDDFGRGTELLVTGGAGRFIGPGIDVSGVRVLRFRTWAMAVYFGHGTMIFGQGACPNGPGYFAAMRISPLPLTRWLLRDVTP